MSEGSLNHLHWPLKCKVNQGFDEEGLFFSLFPLEGRRKHTDLSCYITFTYSLLPNFRGPITIIKPIPLLEHPGESRLQCAVLPNAGGWWTRRVVCGQWGTNSAKCKPLSLGDTAALWGSRPQSAVSRLLWSNDSVINCYNNFTMIMYGVYTVRCALTSLIIIQFYGELYCGSLRRPSKFWFIDYYKWPVHLEGRHAFTQWWMWTLMYAWSTCPKKAFPTQ